MMLRRFSLLLLLILGVGGLLSACRTPRRAADGTALFPFRPGREVPPVLAVVDFENRASWAGQWNLSGGMADLLVARLMETRRVVVIERQHLGDVIGEITRQGNDLFRKEGRAERGRLKNAQYLLRGTITDFTVIEESSGGFRSFFLRVFGRGSRARVAIAIKVYDVENGEVMASVKSDGTVASGGGGTEVAYKQVSFGGDSFFRTPLGKATERALDRAVDKILAALPIAYWSPRVAEAGREGGGPAVVVNGGANVHLKPGDEFVVRDLPWTIEKLKSLPPFEFENWAVIALGGRPNKAQVGDMGIDGRIYPVSAMGEAQRAAKSRKAEAAAGELDFMDQWYPIQAKQMDKVGRPMIDEFETAMNRAGRAKGFFVAFGYTQEAMSEIGRFFTAEHKVIVPLTVREILDEQIAAKLA